MIFIPPDFRRYSRESEKIFAIYRGNQPEFIQETAKRYIAYNLARGEHWKTPVPADVREAAPEARVLVVGYPPLMPSVDAGMPASFESWIDAGARLARVRYRGASWDARVEGAEALVQFMKEFQKKNG